VEKEMAAKLKWEKRHPPETNDRDDDRDFGPLFDAWGTGDCLYAAGGMYMDAVILCSRGGAPWAPLDLGEDRHGLRGIWGRSADDLFAVGEYGAILHTTDGGKTWTTPDTPTSGCLYKIGGAPSGAIYVTGDEGLLRSTDGTTWETLQTDTDERMLCLWFIGADVIFAAGGGGTIIRTTDGGQSWAHLRSGVTKPLCGLWGRNTQHLVAIGDGGTIVITQDGGETWQAPKSGTKQDLEDIAAGFSGELLVVGNGGTVLTSEDGGLTWTANPSDLRTHIWAAWLSAGGSWVISADDGEVYVSRGLGGRGPVPIPY
jgi:photosystem II stability/assembly factor-like uncharacterized protein